MAKAPNMVEIPQVIMPSRHEDHKGEKLLASALVHVTNGWPICIMNITPFPSILRPDCPVVLLEELSGFLSLLERLVKNPAKRRGSSNAPYFVLHGVRTAEDSTLSQSDTAPS